MSEKMTTCKDCGAKVSKSAKICPNCGAKLKKAHPVRVIIGILIIIISLGAIASSDTPTPTNTSENLTVEQSLITKENYDKIEKGMTEAQVESILGSQTSTSENDIAGVTTKMKHYQEPLSLQAIDVYFQDGKVTMKNWTDLQK